MRVPCTPVFNSLYYGLHAVMRPYLHARRYLLSQHPEVERKLAQELDAAGLLVTPERPKPRAMEYTDLGRLTYLSWVCKVRNPE
jgi:hypothetical protein